MNLREGIVGDSDPVIETQAAFDSLGDTDHWPNESLGPYEFIVVDSDDSCILVVDFDDAARARHIVEPIEADADVLILGEDLLLVDIDKGMNLVGVAR